MRTRALLPAALILAALGVAAPFGPALADCVTSNMQFGMLSGNVNWAWDTYQYTGSVALHFDCVGPTQAGDCWACVRTLYYKGYIDQNGVQQFNQLNDVDNAYPRQNTCQNPWDGTINVTFPTSGTLDLGATYRVEVDFAYPYQNPTTGAIYCDGNYTGSTYDDFTVPNE